MSNRNQEALRQHIQFMVETNAASGTLAFNNSEFSRLPDDSEDTLQIAPETLQQVVDALYRSLTVGIYSMMLGKKGCSVEFIAAQFKTTNMRQSQLEPRVIEGALTKIINNLDDYPQLKAIKCNLTYTTDGSTLLAGKGVRVFCIEGTD